MISVIKFDKILKNKDQNFQNFTTYYNYFKNFGYIAKILFKLQIIPKILFLRYFGDKN